MKKVGVILTVICMLLSSFPAFGGDAPTVQAALDVNDFYVDISADGLAAFSRITVIAAKEAESAPEALLSGAPAYLEQLETGTAGTFSRSVKFHEDAEPGYYVIRVMDSKNGVSCVSEPFVYLGEDDTLSAVDAINNASKSTMQSVIEANSGDLLLDLSEYSAASATAKAKTAELLLELRPTGGYAGVADVNSAFGACVATAVLPETAGVSELLEKYADNLKIDYALYSECTAKEQSAINELLQNKNSASPEDLADYYPEAVFAGRANAASTAGELQQMFLKDYASELDLDLSDYKKLKNSTKVFTNILGKKLTGYESARDAFYDAVDDASDDGGSTGGGSGSSRGGSAGGGLAIGAAEQPADNAPEVPVTPNSAFTDLASVPWAVESINRLYASGVVSGDGNGSFRPNDSVTRAEFIKMLICAFGIEPVYGVTAFSDAPEGAWYTPYVKAGASCGIVKGMSDSYFGADISITREDLTVMCSRMADYSGLSLPVSTAAEPLDSELIADYALESVFDFYRAGIVNGDTDGSFRPKSNATRAEAAKIIAGLKSIKEGA